MKNALELLSLSSSDVDIETWYPLENEDVFISLDLVIGYSDGEEGGNLFYVTLATPESLRKYRQQPILVENRTIVISEYSFYLVKEELLSILRKCSRNTWEESCLVLQRYFQWEYEDYISE